MKAYIFLTLFMFGLCQISFSQGGSRDKIESLKIAFITERLELSPEEAQQFWPIYNQFQKDKRALYKGIRAGKRDQDAMTEAEAKSLIELQLKAEEAEIGLKRTYVNNLSKVLSYQKIVLLEKSEREFKEKLLERMRDRKGRG